MKRAPVPARLSMAACAMFLFALPGRGQTNDSMYRCDIEVKTQTINGFTVPVGFSPDSLNGKTITVPINVTRISYDGLVMQLPVEVGVLEPADVVFINDQSGSMRDMDPNWQVPVVTRAAIQQLRDLQPTSTVGFIGFSQVVCDTLSPVSLDQQANVDRLNAMTNYTRADVNCGDTSWRGSATNYYDAFVLATRWLNDPTKATHTKKAIVFLTDGEPNIKVDEFWNLVNQNLLPPTYSIYLGGNYDLLRNVSNRTGGAFYPVDPQQPQQLRDVFTDIISRIITRTRPTSAVVTNQTNGQSSRASDSDFVLVARTNWQVNLDSIIALNVGVNNLTMRYSIFNAQTNQLEQDTISFVIDVKLDSAKTLGDIDLPGTPFKVVCYHASRLTYTGEDYQIELPVFPLLPMRYGIVLHTAPSSRLRTTTTDQAVDKSRDSEQKLVLDGQGSEFRNVFQFTPVSGSGTPGNRITEAQLNDSVRVQWVHPRDPRDRATRCVSVQRVTLSGFWTADHDGNGYLDRIEVRSNIPFDAHVVIAPASVTVTYGNVTYVIDSVGGRSGAADSVTVLYLHQNTTGAMETGWQPQVSINSDAFLYNGGPVNAITAADSAGPVVYRAFYRPGNPDDDRDDSILVVFSEPVIWQPGGAPGDVFAYYQQSDQSSQAFAGLTATGNLTQPDGSVIRMTNAFKVEPGDDYIKLADNGRYVKDAAGNATPENGRRCEIESDADGMRVVAVANPFTPGRSRIPSSIVDLTHLSEQYGTVVIVKPFKPLVEAWISLYDNTGNTIVKKTAMVKDPNSNRFYFPWDGHNQNGRYVGAGAYMAVATGRNEAGSWYTKKCKVGVK